MPEDGVPIAGLAGLAARGLSSWRSWAYSRAPSLYFPQAEPLLSPSPTLWGDRTLESLPSLCLTGYHELHGERNSGNHFRGPFFFLSTCKMKVTFGCQRALRLMTEIPHSRTGSTQPRCSTLTVIFIPTTCEQCYCTCSPDGKTEAPRS